MADLAELERRLALLEDERAILRRLYAYGHAIDYGDEDAWANCFPATASSTSAAGCRTAAPGVVGRDAIRAFIAGHTRAPELWHKHLLVEPLIAIDGDAAGSSAYFAVLMEHEEEPVLRVFGRYRDRLIREADGEWRLRERIAEIESMRAGLPPFIGDVRNRSASVDQPNGW